MFTSNTRRKLLMWLIGILIFAIWWGIGWYRRFENPKPSNPFPISIGQQKLERYIGDKHIAKAIAESEHWLVIAAIGKVESEYKPQVRGDGGDSFGMFQIQQQHHGSFDDRLESQVIKCESIIKPLIIQYGLKEGIRRYNGDGAASRLYARKVIRVMKEIQNV